MAGTGTDEDTLFTSLVNLNGSQLQQVYEAYDIKEGKDLFGWYQDELNESAFASLVYYCGWLSLDCEDGQVPGCETYWDACTEAAFMRSIWQKSGLPITF